MNRPELTVVEKWEWVQGYEGLYKVSSKGNVKSYYGKTNTAKDVHDNYIIMSPALINQYLSVSLHKDKKSKMFRVHRLVATAFLENENQYKYVNHIDGNKTNNSVDNLEWCTNSMNILHSLRTGLSKNVGETHCHSKLKESYIPEIIFMKENGYGMTFIGRLYGVDAETIRAIFKGKTWKKQVKKYKEENNG